MLMHGAVAGMDCPPTVAAPSPSSSARCRLGPAGGHAGKRRRQQQHEAGLGLGLLLPHLGVEQFLQAAGHPPHVAAAAPYASATPAAAAVAELQPLFPTLDSWNVMHGKKNEVVWALTAAGHENALVDPGPSVPGYVLLQ